MSGSSEEEKPADLFLVTSVINTGNVPWSYTPIRSCFAPETRFLQTLKTIDSIRTYHPTAKILLVEASDMSVAMGYMLQKRVDYYAHVYKKENIKEICLGSTNKGYGEVTLLNAGCEYIKENGIKFNRLFKLSGRYHLNSRFNKDAFNETDALTFKMIEPNNGITVLYSIPYELFDYYINKITYCIEYYKNNPPRSIENILPCICATRRVEIPDLGVSGQVAVFNSEGGSDSYDQ